MNDYTIDDFEHLINATMIGHGTEAFDIKGSVTKLLGGMKKYFGDKLRGFDKPLVDVDVNGARKIVGKYNYTDLMDQSLFVPGRLNMPYNEWVFLLGDVTGFCVAVQNEQVPSVVTWVASCMAEKASVVYTPHTSKFDMALSGVERKLTIALNGKDVETTTFGMAYDRMMSFMTSYQELGGCVNRIKKGGPAALRTQVERLSVLSDELFEQINSGEVSFTPTQVKVFSDLILHVARSVDVYSVIMSLLISTAECMNNNVTKLSLVKK